VVFDVFQQWYFVLFMAPCVASLLLFIWPACYHRMNIQSNMIVKLNAPSPPTDDA
jgi:hypothetical protein